ncbi:MAG: hypothetical protein FJ255_08200 [Phycisphaerae bacterium]|nr:hypothetical protein [Phycisphaerae bacterium]
MPLRTHVALTIAGVSLLGCVTEGPRRPAASASPDAAGPLAPVARPADAARVSTSRVVVSVAPAGAVGYDGQSLPIVSPDGRFLAVQEGDPPPWPTLLADPSATPAHTSRLAVYDLAEPIARRVEWPEQPPMGLVAGRGADSTGVLVEWPREDGARWIGRLLWLSGQVQWLVTGDTVNAHAAWTADSRLVYTRRGVADLPEATHLVVLNADGSESTRRAAGGAYAFPLTTSDASVVYALVRTPSGTDIEAVRMLADTPHSPARLGSTLARRTVSRRPEPAMGFQITAPVQTAPPRTGAGSPDPALFYHPDLARMVTFEARESSFGLLAPRSIAAVRWTHGGADGYLCTTPEGLVFTPTPPAPSGEEARRAPDVRVIAGHFVPRATDDAARPVLLVGPQGKDPTTLVLMRLSPEAP